MNFQNPEDTNEDYYWEPNDPRDEAYFLKRIENENPENIIITKRFGERFFVFGELKLPLFTWGIIMRWYRLCDAILDQGINIPAINAITIEEALKMGGTDQKTMERLQYLAKHNFDFTGNWFQSAIYPGYSVYTPLYEGEVEEDVLMFLIHHGGDYKSKMDLFHQGEKSLVTFLVEQEAWNILNDIMKRDADPTALVTQIIHEFPWDYNYFLNLEQLKFLHNHGLNVNLPFAEKFPLLTSIYFKEQHKDILQFLMENGAKLLPRCYDQYGGYNEWVYMFIMKMIKLKIPFLQLVLIVEDIINIWERYEILEEDINSVFQLRKLLEWRHIVEESREIREKLQQLIAQLSKVIRCKLSDSKPDGSFNTI